MVENINQIELRQTQSQENVMISSNDEINPTIIINKQPEQMEVNQSMSSGGFPLLTQQQQTTPDKNKVNQNDLPPKSSSSSPNHNDSSSNTTTKRSPVRTGIMSRFAKSPHRIKYNNVLLNALPINLTEPVDTTKSEVIIFIFIYSFTCRFVLDQFSRSIIKFST